MENIMRAFILVTLAAVSTACGQLPAEQASMRTEEGPGPIVKPGNIKPGTGGMSFALPPEEETEGHDKAVAFFQVTLRGWAECNTDSTDNDMRYDLRSQRKGDEEDETKGKERVCGGMIYEGTQSIYLADTRELNLADLPVGLYDVEVRLYDANDQVLEEGFAGTYVSAGTSSRVEVQLYAVGGNGSLTVSVIRAGKKVVYQDDGQEEPWEYDAH